MPPLQRPFPTPPLDLAWCLLDYPTPEFYNVTPELAKLWLDANRINRKKKDVQINKYLGDMERGDWFLNGEAIKFSTDGNLHDGQNRCIALSQASVDSISTLVVRGLPTESQKYMDQGAARTAADRFGFMGESHTNVLAAVVAFAIRVERGGGTFDPKVSVSQSLQERWLLENPDIRDAVGWGLHKPFGATSTAMVYTAFRLRRVDQEAAEAFLTALSTGVGLPAQSPILAAQKCLTNRVAQDRVRPTAAIVDLLFRTWNLWRKGQGAHKLQFREAVKLLPAPI